jgi:L-lactate utilization protein LutB
MNEVKNWFIGKRIERTISSLLKNGFKADYALTRDEAVAKVLELIPNDAVVGVGGSMTIREIGLVDMLVKRGNKVVQHWQEGLSAEGVREAMRRELNSDVFLSSSNAITERGQLVNIDNAGNRVAAMIFGPKKTVIIAETNKIVYDLDDAMKRLRNVASPMDAKRLNSATPCLTSGICIDCDSPGRLCRVTTIMDRKPAASDITVILVNEELGY